VSTDIGMTRGCSCVWVTRDDGGREKKSCTWLLNVQ